MMAVMMTHSILILFLPFPPPSRANPQSGLIGTMECSHFHVSNTRLRFSRFFSPIYDIKSQQIVEKKNHKPFYC